MSALSASPVLAAPDLTVEITSVSTTTLFAGDAITIYYRYSNIGLINAPASTIKFCLSSDTDCEDQTDISLGFASTQTLGVNQTSSINNTTKTVPSATVATQYYLVAWIDPTASVDEENDNNNTYQYPTKITVKPAAPPGSFSLSTPSNHNPFSSSTTQVTLTWGNSSGAASYEVYFGTSNPPPRYITATGQSQKVNVEQDTKYYWNVSATAGSLSTASSNGPFDFTVAQGSSPSPPGAFTLKLPTDKSTVAAGASVSLSWNASQGATSYDVFCGTNSSSPTKIENTSSTSSVCPVIGARTYYWTVTAKNGSGSTPTSSGTFWFATPLGDFNLTSPENESSLSSTTTQVDLTWTSSSGASYYDVYFGTSPAPGKVTDTTATTSPVSVESGQTYYWWIQAIGGGSFKSSPVRWFKIPPGPPASFRLTVPDDEASLPSSTTAVYLEWEGAARATSYDVYFGESTNFGAPTNVTTTNTSKPVSADKRYYWTVKAKNSMGETATSSGTRALNVQGIAPPGVFTLKLPPDKSTVAAGTSVSLSWNVSEGATSYDVFCGTSSSSPTKIESTSSTSATCPVIVGTTYYWTVTAKNGGGSTPTSSGTWSFSPPVVTRAFELELYQVSDTAGTPHTSLPGTARSNFTLGETLRVTMRARNTGTASESVNWVLNLAPDGSHSNIRFDSDNTPNNTPDMTVPNNGTWVYYSFDWPTTAADPIGEYDLLGSLRLGSDWATVFDDTEPGVNTTQFNDSAWRAAGVRLGVGIALHDYPWQTVTLFGRPYVIHIVTTTALTETNRALSQTLDGENLKHIYVEDQNGQIVTSFLAVEVLLHAQSAKKFAALNLDAERAFSDRVKWYAERIDRQRSGFSPYTVWAPSASDNWWRELFLFPYLDLLDRRTSHYAEVVLDAVLQPGLAADVASDRRVKQALEQFMTWVEVPGQVSDVKDGILDITDHILNIGQLRSFNKALADGVIPDRDILPARFLKHIEKLNAGLEAVSFFTNLTHDVVQALYMQACASALADERLAALEDFVEAHRATLDPALVAGVTAAREEFDRLMDQAYGELIVQALVDVENFVDAARFTANVAAVLKAGAYHGLAQALGPWFLSWDIAMAIRDKSLTATHATLAATLHEEMALQQSDGQAIFPALQSALQSPTLSGETSRDASHLAGIRMYLGWMFYDRTLDLYRNLFYGLFSSDYRQLVSDLESDRAEYADWNAAVASPYYFATHEAVFDRAASDSEAGYLLTRLRFTRPSTELDPLSPEITFQQGSSSGTARFTVDVKSSTNDASASYAWTFGDGASAQGPDPSPHVYQRAGQYRLTLTVTLGATSSSTTVLIDVRPPRPAAGFEADVRSGQAPFEVRFTDHCTDCTSRIWFFGDGSSSSDVNPSHTYVLAGTYPVTQTAYGPGGQASLTKTNYVTVTGAIGTIAVVTDAAASFVLEGPIVLVGRGPSWSYTSAPAGRYRIRYENRAAFATPQDETRDLAAGGIIEFYASYLPGNMTVMSIAPAAATAAGGTPVTIVGTNFASGARVWVGGVEASAVVVLDDATINAVTGAHAPGIVDVVVTNSDLQTATLPNWFLYEQVATNPVPTLTQIAPAESLADGQSFVVTVTGANFVGDSLVRWNGSDRVTTYVSPTELRVVILASDVSSPGSATVTVFNPAPAGGTSTGQTFTIRPLIIDTLTLDTGPTGTPNPSAPGQAVDLRVGARTVAGRTLQYLWQASCDQAATQGSFSPNATVATPRWTPPLAPAGLDMRCLVRVMVVDGVESTTPSFEQKIVQSADAVTITAGPTGTPNPVASGGAVALSVTARDALNHVLDYGWQATCPTLGATGTWANGTTATPTWTAPVNPTGSIQDCTLTVRVDDGAHGQSASASLVQRVNPAATGPTITTTALPDGVRGVAYTQSVSATGGTPTYTWSWQAPQACVALAGSYCRPPDGLTLSPGGSITGTPTLEGGFTFLVRVIDAASRSAEKSLTLTVGGHTLTITAGPGGTPNPVGASGTVALNVTAVDSANHPLTYGWTASCPSLASNGAWANGTTASPTWTAPPNPAITAQACTLGVTVTDGASGLSATKAYTQTVTPVEATRLTLDTGPTGTPNPSAPGQAVDLRVGARTVAGRTLQYLWQASCDQAATQGSFSPNATVATPRWTPPLAPAGLDMRCLVRVMVVDGVESAAAQYLHDVRLGLTSTATQESAPLGPALAGTNGFGDADSDDMDDGWESRYGLDPTIAADRNGDPDGDGLANVSEHRAGTDPRAPDTDADGVSDGAELANGDNPIDPADWRPPALTATVGDGSVYLSWPGRLPGDRALLNVQRLSPEGNWETLGAIPLDLKTRRYRLDVLPTGESLSRGSVYGLGLTIGRRELTRSPDPSEIVTVRPTSVAPSISLNRPLVFAFEGTEANGDASVQMDVLHFARRSLAWPFGGVLCPAWTSLAGSAVGFGMATQPGIVPPQAPEAVASTIPCADVPTLGATSPAMYVLPLDSGPADSQASEQGSSHARGATRPELARILASVGTQMTLLARERVATTMREALADPSESDVLVLTTTEWSIPRGTPSPANAVGYTLDGVLCSVTVDCLVISATGPVALTVTDPNGHVLSERISEIPGAAYRTRSGDGDYEVTVTIPFPTAGKYMVSLHALPIASHEDTYGLRATSAGLMQELASGQPLATVGDYDYAAVVPPR